ncbi:hypothetical protein AB0L40_02400 [Patulibacter sp. NPDC049589]|uniref:hypothetical protein n=1 Tax=Patulibacter sp. NPDC049589 TaxID=3154731 RepID=UPI003431ADE7
MAGQFIDARYPGLVVARICEHAAAIDDSGHRQIRHRDDLAIIHPAVLDAWVPDGMGLQPTGPSFMFWDDEDVILKISGALTIGDETVGRLARELNTCRGYAEHWTFWLDENAPAGRHFGARQLRRSAELYQRLSVPLVRTSPTFKGRYVWTRCGFTFRNEQHDHATTFADAATRFLVAMKRWDERSDPLPRHVWASDYLRYDGTRNQPNVVTADEIVDAHRRLDFDSDLTPPPEAETLLGRALLLFAPVIGWDASLDLMTEPRAISDLDGYTRKYR